jgi:hypothetical protein
MNAKSWIAVAAIVSTTACFSARVGAAEKNAHDKRPAIAVTIDKAPLEIDAAQLRLAVGESIRSALAEAERAAGSAQPVKVAIAAPRNGG